MANVQPIVWSSIQALRDEANETSFPLGYVTQVRIPGTPYTEMYRLDQAPSGFRQWVIVPHLRVYGGRTMRIW